MSFHCSLFLIWSLETIQKKLLCSFFDFVFFLAFLSVNILSFSGKVVNRIKYDSNIHVKFLVSFGSYLSRSLTIHPAKMNNRKTRNDAK